jgi:hypothetical protein
MITFTTETSITCEALLDVLEHDQGMYLFGGFAAITAGIKLAVSPLSMRSSSTIPF